jgi:predicted CopG family antitoxin
MLSKTITVTQEAYNALLKERKNNESISETIMRLTKNHKPANTLSRRILETEKENVQHTFGDGWFSSSDLI